MLRIASISPSLLPQSGSPLVPCRLFRNLVAVEQRTPSLAYCLGGLLESAASGGCRLLAGMVLVSLLSLVIEVGKVVSRSGSAYHCTTGHFCMLVIFLPIRYCVGVLRFLSAMPTKI